MVEFYEENISIKSLLMLRSAPSLTKKQRINLMDELLSVIDSSDWFTVGIMAPSAEIAVNSLREIEKCLDWNEMKMIYSMPKENEPVFLKGNQKSGNFFIRNEDGLGKGILLSCQYNNESLDADTLGPFPLDFFRS